MVDDPDLSVPEGRAFTEAELTALALSADPDGPLDHDAVPLAQYLGERAGLLPAWYMPAPMARTGQAVAHPGGGGHRGRLPHHRGLRPVQHLRAARPGLIGARATAVLAAYPRAEDYVQWCSEPFVQARVA